jgi:hypothetical protein
VLDKGLGGDEMGERVRLVIDGVDGHLHHIELDAARAEDVGRGMIAMVGSTPTGPRQADLNILDVAGPEGVYRQSEHLERAQDAIDRLGGDPAAFVRSHVRRLEALRRAGHVERIDADHWRVPADLAERGIAHDARNLGNFSLRILSTIDLEQQIGSDGATWLDRELVSANPIPITGGGFGREVADAIERRQQTLIDMGHAVRTKDGGLRMSKNLVANLEAAEVARVGRVLAAERGLNFTFSKIGEYVSGTLVGSTQIASGRFAMIDDGIGFQLVPWQPLLEQRIGRHITGVMRDAGGIDWSFGRNRGLEL